MKNSWKILGKSVPLLMLLLFLGVIFLSVSVAFAQKQGLPKRMDRDIIPGHYIVVLRDHVRNPAFVAEDIARYHRFPLGHVYKRALKGFSARIPDALLGTVARDPDVAFIEPDRWVYAVGQTIPTGVERMGTLQNTTAKIDGVEDTMDVDIAIIDTGIDLDHLDLKVHKSTNCARWQNGCRDGQGNDGHGHGTHVAGIAAARDNGLGVVGVAPGARLWAVRVMNDSGWGYLSWIINGIEWVTDHANEIEVANMSLAWTGYSEAAHTAIKNSVNEGVVYFAAAGNSVGDDPPIDIYGGYDTFRTNYAICPAAFPEVAAISALHDTDGKPGDDYFASFSNFSTVEEDNPVDSPGMAIDLMCPGVNILSTYKDNGLYTWSGTSMASAHAAGLAALYIAQYGLQDDLKSAGASGVYDIRQALIYRGVEQDNEDYGLVQNDPYGYPEKLGWAGATEPVTDIAIAIEVNPPSPVVLGTEVSILVTVSNVGTEVVDNYITITVIDETIDNEPIGEDRIDGLAPGDPYEFTFSWTPTSADPPDHTLKASLNITDVNGHIIPDDNDSNDSASTTVRITSSAVPTSVHIADLDGVGSKGWIWTATVTITVEDDLGQPVPNAVVHGTFSDGPSDFACMTDPSGTCSVVGYQWVWLYKCLTYTVEGVDAGLPYFYWENQDPDGGNSTGTKIKVCRGSEVF